MYILLITNYDKIKTRLYGLVCIMLWTIGSMGLKAQSMSEGDVYIDQGGEAVVYNMTHNFLSGSTASLPGLIVTDRTGARGYFSFVQGATWSLASDKRYIDGYARSYMSTPFIFPIGQNGRYRPMGISTASLAAPIDAAYYSTAPDVIGAAKGSNIQAISPAEYWDINGSQVTNISLTWDVSTNIATLTAGDLTTLTILGYNGSQWVEVASSIDAESILGGSSSMTTGSITASGIVPSTYEFYTLGSKVKIMKLGDTTLVVSDTSHIILGPSTVPDTNIVYSVSGPFHGAGLATINSQTGVLTFIPSYPAFVGNDTIYKIRCIRNGAITICDTIRIVLTGKPLRIAVSDTAQFNTAKTLKDLPPITTGGKPLTTTATSSAASTVTVDSNGKVNYLPRVDFSGIDTVRVIRCVGNICDTVTYIINVLDPDMYQLPNYISPNGDGVNDVWNIDYFISKYPNTKAVIYNRWGSIVWRSTGAYGKSTGNTNVWFGQLESSQETVPDGVYYYLIEIEDEYKTSKTGFIEVMRR